MKLMTESTQSVWMETAPRAFPTLPGTLQRDTVCDVCVIGAGIAGLTTAYLLSRYGLDVIVLDSRQMAAGQTQRTSAHLSNAHDDRYFEIEKIYGEEGTRIAAASHTAAIDFIERTVAEHAIDCDFKRVPGYLFCGQGHSQDILDQELGAALRAGIPNLELVGRAPIAPFDTGRCLRFPQQGQFHPLDYLAGLATVIQQNGGQIFDETHVKEVEGGDSATVTTAHGPTVKARSVVVATNTPMNDMYAIHTKQAPYLSYVIGVPVPPGAVSPALYWDTEDPYHYLRLVSHEDGDLLLVGGEDHKAGQVTDQDDRHARLEHWIRERIPGVGPVQYEWSGMVMETTDGCAFIGRNPGDAENIFIATGDSGMGLTHGTIAGLILLKLVQGHEHPWADFYDPSRKPISGMAGRNFLSENANVAYEYVRDYLFNDAPEVQNLELDAGTVLREGLSKVAVYRDQQGQLHKCSAVCPHLGCVVHWNKLEKVWDCPCHGSRFDAYGHVINAPAISNLKPIPPESSDS